ncbi:MAG: HAD family phosphatase, partial [Treponema sp.]|nr:HAD family phosphatase [Treponema sp.]
VIRFSQIKNLPFELIKYKLGRIDIDFIEKAVLHIAGIEKEQLDFTADLCFERRITPNIFTGAANLIQKAQDRGEKVVFATSSLYTIVRPLEKFFQANAVLASALEFSGGRATGRLMGNSLFGQKKKEAVQKWLEENKIHPSESCCYSDSYTDIPLLNLCGKPVAVNPDRFLKKEALQCGWEILYFKNTLGNNR